MAFRKNLLAILTVLTILFNSFIVFTEVGTAKSKELDNVLAQIEKNLLAGERQETELEGLIINGVVYADDVPKIPDNLVKAAVKKKLDEIKNSIEITEEELGGLSQEEYKKVAIMLIEGMYKQPKPMIYWEDDKKTASIMYEVENVYEGLDGNFKRMGKEKDEVDQADLKVEGKIKKYLEQSTQKGNKINPEILSNLPGKVQSLFDEYNLSKIVAARSISIIHNDIYDAEISKYDGSESLDDILDTYRQWIESKTNEREEETKFEDYKYPADLVYYIP